MKAQIMALPLWIRKFLVDFIETAIGGIGGINLAVISLNSYGFPVGVDQWKVLAASCSVAILTALFAAARRHASDFRAWLAAVLQTS